MMQCNRLTGLVATLAMAAATMAPGVAPGVAAARGGHAPSHVYRWYQHIFVIMLENHAHDQIIGNPLAPHLNALARTYGLAMRYYGITHPSEPNYVAVVGGNYFGIQDDAPYTTKTPVNHTIAAPNLADQVEAAGLTWTSYQQGLPYVGYTGVAYPTTGRPLYLSKHNPFLNFADVQHNRARLRHIVPIAQLDVDVRGGRAPNVGFIVPDLCHDMHGQWPMCRSPHAPGDAYDRRLIRLGDAYVGTLVQTITSSPMWSVGNNAVIITWDENDFIPRSKGYNNVGGTGCCDASPGGGRIPTIVITSHGPRGVRDDTPYNHYALLRTVEVALHLGCLQHTCDSAHVHVMRKLFMTRG